MRTLASTMTVLTALLLAGPAVGGTPRHRGTGSPDQDTEIRMVGGRFEPETLTVRPGERVVFRLVSGGPHNAAFWADSIPSDAVGPLAESLVDPIEPLMGPLLVIPGETWAVTMPKAPGQYRYYCLPHLAGRMVGLITVRQD